MTVTRYKNLFIALFLGIFVMQTVQAQEGKVTLRQDERLSRLLEIKKALNKTDDGEKRYRIQIYNGTLSGARDAAAGFKSNFPDWPCDIRFETPNYKVWVGKYRARLEADRYLALVREKYPNAFILIP
ncbi:MAG: SPOR domain-containing protein [Sinomicrobium sp.]|nr:SPOR domain-containing protein [Sinomicrobium sp.]